MLTSFSRFSSNFIVLYNHFTYPEKYSNNFSRNLTGLPTNCWCKVPCKEWKPTKKKSSHHYSKGDKCLMFFPPRRINSLPLFQSLFKFKWWKIFYFKLQLSPSSIFVPEVTKMEFLAFILASNIAVSRLILLLGLGPTLSPVSAVGWLPLAKRVVFVFIGVTERRSSSEGDIVWGLWAPKLELDPEPEPEPDLAISSQELDCSNNSLLVLSLSNELLIEFFVTGRVRILFILSMFFFCFIASLKTL